MKYAHLGNSLYNEICRLHKALVQCHYAPIKCLIVNNYTLNCMLDEGIAKEFNMRSYEVFGLPLKVNNDLTNKIYIKEVIDEHF